MIIFAMTLLLDKVIPDYQWKDDTADESIIYFSIIIHTVFTVVGVCLFLWLFISIAKETLSEGRVKAFYTDLLEILDKMEKNEKE